MAHRGATDYVSMGGVFALCSALLAGCSSGAGPDESPSASPSVDPPLRPEKTLTWADEFDGPADSPPDPQVWTYEIGGDGWGNNERQYYTDSTRNAALDGQGHLVISAQKVDSAVDGDLQCHYGPCAYTSARLVTEGSLELQYGTIEARIKVPSGAGTWPAFWALGSDFRTAGWPASGEIDIMEYVGKDPLRVFGTVHGPGYSGAEGPSGSLDVPEPPYDDWHVFAIDWDAESITWSYDGEPYHRVTADEVVPHEWVFDQPFSLLLNVAVGGTLGGPVSRTLDFPQQMQVDYVRAYAPVD